MSKELFVPIATENLVLLSGEIVKQNLRQPHSLRSHSKPTTRQSEVDSRQRKGEVVRGLHIQQHSGLYSRR